jgi:tetratricopeptide (TPR) repeat protein
MASVENNRSATGEPSYHSREAVLLVSLLLLLVLFLFTAFITRMYKKHIHILADQWFAKGSSSFESGDSAEAVTDFRSALAFSPDNRKFQFQLAKALAASGKEKEAKAYLLTLLSETPGSGEINLELARIAVRQGQTSDAMRYFQGAVYGDWTEDPISKRWEIRKEFCEFLINQGAYREVEGDLIALAENTPSNDAMRLRAVGALLLRAQLWTRALGVFQSVMSLDASDRAALLGAGTAAFHVGDYTRAYESLNLLPAEMRKDPTVSEMYETSHEVTVVNPFLPELPLAQKVERTSKNLATAEARLEQCAEAMGDWNALAANAGGLRDLRATESSMRMDWTAVNLEKHPSRMEPAMNWVFDAEKLTALVCGTPKDQNYALWLLARSRGMSEK